MATELLSNGNLPLTVVLKSLPVLCSFLGEKQEEFLQKFGNENKKLFSKFKVFQDGNTRENLKKFNRIYTSLEAGHYIPVDKKINNTRKAIDGDIRSNIQEVHSKFKNKLNLKQTTEFLVNILIPKDKWIEINKNTLNKLITFYYNKFKATPKQFEEFILVGNNFEKYNSLLSKEVKKYYDEKVFNNTFKRLDLYQSLMYKDKYGEFFKDY
jgi:hypothetical protein